METAAIDACRVTCAHCGLPVRAAPPPTAPEDTFCCHACRLVAIIIGKQEDSGHTWNLLRLGFGSLLAMNVMMISLLLYTGSIEAPTVPIFRRVLLLLSAPALIILIPPFLVGAARELRSRKVSMNALIAGGSLSAFTISTVNAVSGAGEVYFDTATMLPVLVTVGKIIEASAKTRAADLLLTLQALLPLSALRVREGHTDEVPTDALRPGDHVRIRPGERVAIDGTIIEGRSRIEEAPFSGEFVPRFCGPGDSVIAGTVNGPGSLLVLAEKTGTDLLLHRIIDMVGDAWRNGSRAERMAERAAMLFIPVVVAVAACSLLWWCINGEIGRGILSALSVLVVACPCTMGIATPLATSLAIGRAAKAGIIVRGGSVMERTAATEIIFFDKTGTITEGTPVVHEVVPLDPGLDQDELIGRVAALEVASGHVLGKAVIDLAKSRGIEEGLASQVQVFPGRGIAGQVTWRGVTKEVSAGAGCFVTAETTASGMEETGTVIDIAWEGAVRGRMLLSDAVRSDAPGCIHALNSCAVAPVLLSGDRFKTAAAVAGKVGIGEVYASRTPEQKLEAVSAAVAAGRTVAMVGDGVNDAPALAAADIGIAMGGGMDLAKQAGNVVMLSGRLMQIPWLIGLARETVKVIRVNFAWTFGYNAIALAAAAAGLLHPLLAALLMVISSVTVLANSLKIGAYRDPVDRGNH